MKPVIQTQLDPSEGRWFARVFLEGVQIYVTGEYLKEPEAENAAHKWIKRHDKTQLAHG